MDLKVLFGLLLCAMVSIGRAEEKELGASDSQPAAGDDSDMYMEPLEDDHQPASSDLQEAQNDNWFPSFSRSFEHPPSGHSRPIFLNGFQQQEGAYSQRNDPPFQQDVRYNGITPYNKQFQQETVQQPAADKSASLLGDGNFGVIQGGTFYPEKGAYDSDSSGFDDFSSYFHNGHGRPSYFYPNNPKPAKKQQQFENFRDFADINNPPERQYSQYVVVYTNKNGTRTSTTPNAETITASEAEKDTVHKSHIDVKRPKNILESLALLDDADSPTKSDEDNSRTLLLPLYEQGDVIEIPPEKKMSKSKRKLATLLPEKKHEARLIQKAKDMNEPLLALS